MCAFNTDDSFDNSDWGNNTGIEWLDDYFDEEMETRQRYESLIIDPGYGGFRSAYRIGLAINTVTYDENIGSKFDLKSFYSKMSARRIYYIEKFTSKDYYASVNGRVNPTYESEEE